MLLEKMTTTLFRGGCKYGSVQFCITFMRIITLWLCAKLGIAVLPAGCRPIPIEHLDFNRDLAKQLGGRDGVNRAIIFQYLANWIAFNERNNRNLKEGRAWSYNSGGNWARMIGLWTQETIEGHIRFLRDSGLLDSKAMNAHKGDQTLWYALPATAGKASAEKDSHAPEQIALWVDSKTPVRGGKYSTDSSVPQTSNPSSSVSLTSSNSRAHVQVHTNAGGVAQFPKRDLDPKEFSEPKPEVRDAAPSEDGSREDQPPPPVAPAPSPVPAWMPSFFDGCEESELVQILHTFGEGLLQDARKYAENPSRRIDNPAGFVRAQLAKGWRPAVNAVPSGWKALDSLGELAAETNERLEWIISDECDWTPLHKAEARRLLDQRLAVR